MPERLKILQSLFQSIRELLEKGVSVPEVSEHNCCPESLVWSIALEGFRVGNHPYRRLPSLYTTIPTYHGESDAKKPNPGDRSTFPDYRKKEVIKGDIAQKLVVI